MVIEIDTRKRRVRCLHLHLEEHEAQVHGVQLTHRRGCGGGPYTRDRVPNLQVHLQIHSPTSWSPMSRKGFHIERCDVQPKDCEKMIDLTDVLCNKHQESYEDNIHFDGDCKGYEILFKDNVPFDHRKVARYTPRSILSN